MATMHDLSRRGVLQVDSIWRRRHPSYLGVDESTHAPEGGQQAEEVGRAAFGLQIGRAIVGKRPDLVLFLHINLARAAFIARLLGKRRYGIVAYGVEMWSPLDRLRRHALLNAPLVLSISDYTATQIELQQRLPRARVQVIPLALEPRWLEATNVAPSPEPAVRGGHAPRLLSVSRLDPNARGKGIDDVIRALPAVLAVIPDAKYHVVGDGADRGYLEQVAKETGVAASTLFRGSLSHLELIAEYRQADAFVLPSQREGFGLVFLEAMAYGKPVIARRAAAAVEVIVDGQTGVLIDDERGLAPAIISMLTNRDAAVAMGRAGQQRTHEVYSFENFTSRIEAALLAVTA